MTAYGFREPELSDDERARLAVAVARWAAQHPYPNRNVLLFTDVGPVTPNQLAEAMTSPEDPAATALLRAVAHVSAAGEFERFVVGLERPPPSPVRRWIIRVIAYLRGARWR